SPTEVRAVCVAVRLDALIAGAISGEGRMRALAIAVREGSTGRVIARSRYDLSRKTLPQIREKVVSDLVLALERVQRIGTVRALEPSAPLVFEPDPIDAADLSPAAVVVHQPSRRSF